MLITLYVDTSTALTGSSPVESIRHRNLHSSKSFSRFEPRRPDPTSRSRASTIQSGVIPEALSPEKPVSTSERDANLPAQGDVFEKRSSEENSRDTKITSINPSRNKVERLPDDFDELPIELVSLTDRRVDTQALTYRQS